MGVRYVGKETGLKCEGKLRDAKRFTPTTVGTPGGCVLATRDGTLLPGVQTICPPPGMREYGLQTGAYIQRASEKCWKLETVDQNVRVPARDLTRAARG